MGRRRGSFNSELTHKLSLTMEATLALRSFFFSLLPIIVSIRADGSSLPLPAFSQQHPRSLSPRGVAAARRLRSVPRSPLGASASDHSPQIPTWDEIESALQPSFSEPRPSSIDSVLDPSAPSFSADRPTLFRERHGWCPYSERVWLALELKGIPYDTVRIDNTGGGRPAYFGGQTPQLRWPDGRTQGESMDIVRDLDEFYGDDPRYGPRLYPPGREGEVESMVGAFRKTFPRQSRPSSRAAFLFGWDSEPLWKSEFERVLSETNALLSSPTTESSDGGPFLCGSDLTAADIAWAPFLERYAAQLPCLHDDLDPRDAERYPALRAWFDAMDGVPAYACGVKGDGSSWRKVLGMAGFGNTGVPPRVLTRMGEEEVRGGGGYALDPERAEVERGIWEEYSADRPYVANAAAAEAAAVIARNREAIMDDALKRLPRLEERTEKGMPTDGAGLDVALRILAACLIDDGDRSVRDWDGCFLTLDALALGLYLNERMCVPRDMGAMSAAAIKRLAATIS